MRSTPQSHIEQLLITVRCRDEAYSYVMGMISMARLCFLISSCEADQYMIDLRAKADGLNPALAYETIARKENIELDQFFNQFFHPVSENLGVVQQ